MTELKILMEKFGPIIAVVAFFIWRDYAREKSMTATIKELESYIKTTLLEAMLKTTGALTETTGALKDNSRAIDELSKRPCLYNAEKKDT